MQRKRLQGKAVIMSQDQYTHIVIEDEEEEEIFVVGAAAQGVGAAAAAQDDGAAGIANVATSAPAQSDGAAAPCAPVPQKPRKPSGMQKGNAVPFEQQDDNPFGQPMPLLQKIIIAAALVGVAVLVAYLVL